MDLYKLQLDRELSAEGKSESKFVSDFTKAKNQGRLHETAGGQVLMRLGIEQFTAKIKEYLETEHRGQTNKDKNLLKLMMGTPEETALIIMRAILASIGGRSTSNYVLSMSLAITDSLHQAFMLTNLKRENPKLHSYLGSEFRRASARRKEDLIARHIEGLTFSNETHLHKSEKIRIGTTLIDLFIASGSNIVELHKHRGSSSRGVKSIYTILLTEEAINILTNSVYARDMLAGARLTPMIVPPRDWKTHNSGGYLTHELSFVKYRDRVSREFISKQDYSKPIAVLNKLQQVPWRVNSRVADIIYDFYSQSVIDPTSPTISPTSYGKLPIADPPTLEDMLRPRPEYNEHDPTEWIAWNKEREVIKIERDASQSRRMSFYYSLGVAQDMMNFNRFWFVYQMDYRGRVYPHSEAFSPQTQSYIKAMLEFADGQYLTDDGYYWLKVHTANVYGLDKLEFPDRVKWFDENYSKIVETAQDPLGNLSYWTETDSPYEFLAAILGVLDYANGEKVHLPIQLDATCSGIQFYSGLLLDKEGAESVNVIGSKRNDIYQMVADKVNDKLTTGNYTKNFEVKVSDGTTKIFSSITEARSIAGKITRKMTKSNTMTVPYSVSLRGMQDQNWAMMDELQLHGKTFWKGDKYIVNKLLTELNHKSIYELIEGAKLGQEYLKEAASTQLDKPAEWTTPMYNFPIKQAAYKRNSHRIFTPFGVLVISQDQMQADNRKQRLAIAPNVIHSLDSDLLLYCIDYSTSDIGTIHDCFLINPNQGGEIRDLYRQGYVKLMEMRPLSLIGGQLDPEGKIPVPIIGTLDLQDVLKSEYIIS